MGSLLSKVRSFFSTNYKTKIIMIGLDSAGKTTLLYKLKLNENISTIPTIGFNVEELTYKKMTMTVWDIGGQYKIRKLWNHYYDNLDGIVFLIDSNDRARFDEVVREIDYLQAEHSLKGVPILFMANKQDISRAALVGDIIESLNLRTMINREWFMQGCSTLVGNGVYEGLEWLYATIEKKRRGE